MTRRWDDTTTCLDCGAVAGFTANNMVPFYIHDELWNTIAETHAVLCLDCTENRLGRRVSLSDLKECSLTHCMRLGVKISQQGQGDHSHRRTTTVQDICISDPVPVHLTEENAGGLAVENIALRLLVALMSREDSEQKTSHSLLGEAFDLANAFLRRCRERPKRATPSEASTSIDTVVTALLLIGNYDVAEIERLVAGWTEEQRHAVIEWAALEHLSAGDNIVKRVARPEFVPMIPAWKSSQ